MKLTYSVVKMYSYSSDSARVRFCFENMVMPKVLPWLTGAGFLLVPAHYSVPSMQVPSLWILILLIQPSI